jgi:hypothetical protein
VDQDGEPQRSREVLVHRSLESLVHPADVVGDFGREYAGELGGRGSERARPGDRVAQRRRTDERRYGAVSSRSRAAGTSAT